MEIANFKERCDRVKAVRKSFTKLTDLMIKYFSSDDVINQVMSLRGYSSQAMRDVLKAKGIFTVSGVTDITSICEVSSFSVTNEDLVDFGLVFGEDNFILNNRFILPIRSIDGLVTAWVGWYPDHKKYITTSTLGFCREAQFFNMETYANCIEKHNGDVVVVEGIFDTLSVEALGLSAIGNMGLALSPTKVEILTRYNRVFACPDGDKAGKTVNPYLSRGDRVWRLKNDTRFGLLHGACKDFDDVSKKRIVSDLSWVFDEKYLVHFQT